MRRGALAALPWRHISWGMLDVGEMLQTSLSLEDDDAPQNLFTSSAGTITSPSLLAESVNSRHVLRVLLKASSFRTLRSLIAWPWRRFLAHSSRDQWRLERQLHPARRLLGLARGVLARPSSAVRLSHWGLQVKKLIRSVRSVNGRACRASHVHPTWSTEAAVKNSARG